MQHIISVLVVAVALVAAVLLWPQSAEGPRDADGTGSDTGSDEQSLQEARADSEESGAARGLLLDAGVVDGGVTRVPMPEHRAPEELRSVEEAARDVLAERQLEHLRTMAELAEQGSDPEGARLMRARIEALEEARREAE